MLNHVSSGASTEKRCLQNPQYTNYGSLNVENKRKRTSKGQSRMDNPAKLPTLGTQYMFDSS